MSLDIRVEAGREEASNSHKSHFVAKGLSQKHDIGVRDGGLPKFAIRAKLVKCVADGFEIER